MLPIQAPDRIWPYVLDFAREVVGPGAAPAHVDCAPIYGAEENECFAAVEAQIARQGGEALIGWAIWEFPGVYVYAEFHAIWRSPEGVLVDVVPRSAAMKRIVFVPDPNRRYEGLRVDNVRKARVNDPDVQRLFQLQAVRVSLFDASPDNNGWVTLDGDQLDAINGEIRFLFEKLLRRYVP